MALSLPIFLDNHSTTAVDPSVVEAMHAYFSGAYGNPASSSHSFGWDADAAVENARDKLAALIGARATDIVFTSGATESNNLALRGALASYRERGDHLVTAATEHRAVLDTAADHEQRSGSVTYVSPDSDGRIEPAQVAAAVTDRTVLVSVMHANNEIGVIAPIAEITAAVKAKRPEVLVHCDASQSVGRIGCDIGELGVDLLSMSAHKMYGPKGVGALWVRGQPRVRLRPIMTGGGHERGLRAGTLPVPLIAGFGRAAEIAGEVLEVESARIAVLRDHLQARLLAELDGVRVNAGDAPRLAGNLSASFERVDGDALLTELCRTIAVSSGSACSSASDEPSHVLTAIGVDPDLARSTIRFGIGRFNDLTEIDYAADLVVRVVKRLRQSGSKIRK